MSQSVCSVFLFDTPAGELAPTELVDGITDVHLEDVEATWQPARVQGLHRLHQLGVSPRDWPESHHWNWRHKQAAVRGILAYRGFCIVCEDQVQGLMQVMTTQICRLPEQRGKPLVYIDYLESAPWNQSGFSETPRFKGVGTVMLAAAIQLSLDEGFHGRIGLHSLPQAEDYYARIGMVSLGPDLNKQGLMYFEMTPQLATAFLN